MDDVAPAFIDELSQALQLTSAEREDVAGAVDVHGKLGQFNLLLSGEQIGINIFQEQFAGAYLVGRCSPTIIRYFTVQPTHLLRVLKKQF